MKLVVGLGNPGEKYARTRHNAGFMFADLLRQNLGLPEFAMQKKFDALTAENAQGNFGGENSEGEKIILAKPQTFMNDSGKSVSALYHYYKCKPHDLWLIYDDVDLQLGKFRIRQKGSAGTHNGMRSVIAALGFENFPRLRLGIESRGASSPHQQDVSSFVLEPFKADERKLFEKIMKEALLTLKIHLQEG